LEKPAWRSDQRRRNLDFYDLGPGFRALVCAGWHPAPDYDNGVRQGDNLFTGSVVVLDAKTGAYKNHFQLVPRDWHDWDVSNPPALIKTRGGKRLMAVSPKDGHLYETVDGEFLDASLKFMDAAVKDDKPFFC
jgi:glucose dehydrogenase